MLVVTQARVSEWLKGPSKRMMIIHLHNYNLEEHYANELSSASLLTGFINSVCWHASLGVIMVKLIGPKGFLLKCQSQVDGDSLFLVACSNRTGGSGQKVEHRRSMWIQGRTSLLSEWQSSRTGFPERLPSFLLWSYSRHLPVWPIVEYFL